MNERIELVKDTISNEDVNELKEWLSTYPHLTQGKLVKEFEEKFAEWNGSKYAVMVNSGSSANLLISYYLRECHPLKNRNVIVPAISWGTTVMPWIQFGYNPILCDANENNLGVDTNHLEELFIKHNPSVMMLVHVLGFPCDMDRINELCKKYDVILLEDCCEATGSNYNGTKVGNFGLLNSFSTYFGHTFSTIEGGIITTNDETIYNILKMLREHGWTRNIPSQKMKDGLKEQYNVDDFNDVFTFYIPAFNLRSTDLNAKLGLIQLKKLDLMIESRYQNYKIYQSLINNPYWKINPSENLICNFSYPIISNNRSKLVEELRKNNISCRPLIAGNIGNHPFWTDKYGKSKLPFADKIHAEGLYLPNYYGLKKEEIEFICKIVNENI